MFSLQYCELSRWNSKDHNLTEHILRSMHLPCHSNTSYRQLQRQERLSITITMQQRLLVRRLAPVSKGILRHGLLATVIIHMLPILLLKRLHLKALDDTCSYRARAIFLFARLIHAPDDYQTTDLILISVNMSIQIRVCTMKAGSTERDRRVI